MTDVWESRLDKITKLGVPTLCFLVVTACGMFSVNKALDIWDKSETARNVTRLLEAEGNLATQKALVKTMDTMVLFTGDVRDDHAVQNEALRILVSERDADSAKNQPAGPTPGGT